MRESAPQMAVADEIQLIASLARGDNDALIGTPESDWLEFKSAPYGLPDPGQRWQLAKDVAGFANSLGGHIVIGVKTTKHPNEVVEAAISWSAIEKGLIDAESYQAIVKSWVYPYVRGITFTWFPPSASEDRGLFHIHIPAQQDDDKRFIVRRMIDENDRETGALGIPIRDGAYTDWLQAERIHGLMHTQSEGSGVAAPPASAPDWTTRVEQATQRAGELEVMQQWEEDPVYLLQGLPPPGADFLSGFYNEGGPAATLRDPPSLRPAGFNLRIGRDRETVGGGVVHRGSDRAARLDRDGSFTAGGLATRSFLGWAINDNRFPPPPGTWINPLTVVEFTFEFFRFVHDQLVPRQAGEWRFIVTCLRFASADVRLDAGPLRQFMFHEDDGRASDDSYSLAFDATDDAGKDAFAALSHVYALFGRGEETIPYVEDGKVTAALILEAGKQV
jgi:hypothetical protein